MDGVFFFRSLHHVPIDAMEAALAEAARVLKPDGFLCVMEPGTEPDALPGSCVPSTTRRGCAPPRRLPGRCSRCRFRGMSKPQTLSNDAKRSAFEGDALSSPLSIFAAISISSH